MGRLFKNLQYWALYTPEQSSADVVPVPKVAVLSIVSATHWFEQEYVHSSKSLSSFQVWILFWSAFFAWIVIWIISILNKNI